MKKFLNLLGAIITSSGIIVPSSSFFTEKNYETKLLENLEENLKDDYHNNDYSNKIQKENFNKNLIEETKYFIENNADNELKLKKINSLEIYNYLTNDLFLENLQRMMDQNILVRDKTNNVRIIEHMEYQITMGENFLAPNNKNISNFKTGGGDFISGRFYIDTKGTGFGGGQIRFDNKATTGFYNMTVHGSDGANDFSNQVTNIVGAYPELSWLGTLVNALSWVLFRLRIYFQIAVGTGHGVGMFFYIVTPFSVFYG